MSDPIGNFLSITFWRRLFQKTGQGFGWGCAIVFALPLVIGFGWSQFSGRGANNGPANMSPDATLMTVNGDTVPMLPYYRAIQNGQMGTPGEEYVNRVGQIIKALVKQQVTVQEAKRENVQSSDADIDKEIQSQKEQALGKNATDAEFENRLYQAAHMSLSDYREIVARGGLEKALRDRAKKNMVVTEEEARNQSAEVRLTVVLIPTIPGPGSMSKPDPRAKPDAEAQKYAESLLAEVKSGKAKIADIAKANSADQYSAKKGGDAGYMPEFQTNNMSGFFGTLGYGKAFDEAVHQAKKGDYTTVVKSTGFQAGYIFAQVADRRNNLPKDFAPQKVVDQLKEERATTEVNKKLDDLTKAAKVEFASDRTEQKAYYDYFMANNQGDPFSGQTNTLPQAEIDKQKAQAISEIEAIYKKDPANPNAAVLVLANIQNKLRDPKTSAADRTTLEGQLLPLYQNVLKSSEGPKYAYRFGLADALRDKKQFAEAYKNYQMIEKSLDLDTPTSSQAVQEAMQERQQLSMALKTIASPEAPNAATDATVQEQKAQALMGELAQLKTKEAADQKAQMEAMRKQQEEQKKEAEKLKSQKPPATGALTPGTTGATVAPGSSATQTITLPAPTGGATPTPALTTPSTSKPAAPGSAGGSKPTTPGSAGH